MRRSSLRHPRSFLLLLLGGLATAALAGVVMSGAGFSSATGLPTSIIRAATDWVAPTVERVAVSNTLSGTPTGAPGFVRATGTYRIYANVTDTNSGVRSVSADATALGGAAEVPMAEGSYTVGMSTYNYASAELTVPAGTGAGLRNIPIQVSDEADNERTDTDPTVTVDNTGPETAMVDPGTPLRLTETLTAAVTDTPAGVATVEIQRKPSASSTWTSVCTATAEPYSCSWDTLAGPDGMYDLRAIATDNAGNTTTSATLASRQVDNSHPGVYMTDPGAYVRGSIVLTTTTDPGGSPIAEVQIQFSSHDQNAWQTVCTDTTDPFDCPVDTSQVPNGTYDVRAIATDAAGNSGISPVATTVVDNTAPSNATLTAPATNQRATITLAGTAADATSGIATLSFEIAPASTTSWTSACVATSPATSCQFDTTTLADGVYQYRMIATDRAGNTRTSATATNRRIDNAAPATAMTDPGAAIRATITLASTTTDAGSGVASVTYQRSPAGQGAWSDICTGSSSPFSCSWNTTTTPEGLYDLRAVATDAAGNTAQSAVLTDRRVDNTAPTAVAMTDPGSPLRASVALTGAATDTGSGIGTLTFQRAPTGKSSWVTVCTATAPAASCAYDTTAVGDGIYDFRMIAADVAGNTTTSATIASRRIDNTAPTATLANPGTYLKGSVALSATGADNGSGLAAVAIQTSPAGQNTWTTACTAPASPANCALDTTSLPDGAYDLRAMSTDVAGNTGTSTALTNRIVDNAAPAVTLDPVPDPVRGTTTLTASAQDAGSGVASVKFQRSPTGAGTWTDICTDATAPYSCNFNTTALTSGTYDIRAVATDSAGNAGDSNVETSTVDNAKPTAANLVTLNVTGGTAGKAEAGDSLGLTFSEQMDPDSILAGWDGSPVTVTLRFAAAGGNQPDKVTFYDQADATQLALGTVTLGKDYVSANATFTATMQRSGTSIAFILGTPSNAASFNVGPSVRASWQPSNLATDLAGNPAATTTFQQPAPTRLQF